MFVTHRRVANQPQTGRLKTMSLLCLQGCRIGHSPTSFCPPRRQPHVRTSVLRAPKSSRLRIQRAGRKVSLSGKTKESTAEPVSHGRPSLHGGSAWGSHSALCCSLPAGGPFPPWPSVASSPRVPQMGGSCFAVLTAVWPGSWSPSELCRSPRKQLLADYP